MNLADVLRTADPDCELAPDQESILAGRPVLLRAVLERTAVVELDGGERLPVRHEMLEVPDPQLFRWQRRALTPRDAHIARSRRSGQLASRRKKARSSR